MTIGSIFVTAGGDWKLGGLDFVSPVEDANSLLMVRVRLCSHNAELTHKQQLTLCRSHCRRSDIWLADEFEHDTTKVCATRVGVKGQQELDVAASVRVVVGRVATRFVDILCIRAVYGKRTKQKLVETIGCLIREAFGGPIGDASELAEADSVPEVTNSSNKDFFTTDSQIVCVYRMFLETSIGLSAIAEQQCGKANETESAARSNAVFERVKIETSTLTTTIGRSFVGNA